MNWTRERYMQWIFEQEQRARDEARESLDVEEGMIKSCHVYYKNENPYFAVICIPGRANDGALFANEYFTESGIDNAVFVGPTPDGYAWYPMPHDAKNQSAALQGIPRAIKAIEAVRAAVEKRFDIPKRRTILAGFSAGGVMAIQTAAYSEEPYAGVICHSGAILEPKDLPMCKNQGCPVLLTHNRDDMCFEWYERFLPMKEVLIKKGWKTYTLERNSGGHVTSSDDMSEGAYFIRQECRTVSIEGSSFFPSRYELVSE